MISLNSAHTRWLLTGLAGLMAITRFHHAGTPLELADASLAVFFLTGLFARHRWFFWAFLAQACAIDYVAIAFSDVSSYCISPAYFFLVPTYAVMWSAGRLVREKIPGIRWPVLGISASILVSTTVAFIISNGSFFLFSGRFGTTDWLAYVAGIMSDFPGYIGSVAFYCSGLLGAVVLLQPRSALEPSCACDRIV